jgi:membrane protein
MAVIISVLAAFPAFQELIQKMQDFIFSNFVPASGEVVQDYVAQFADKAGNLTAVGTIFLVITSLMLMDTIDGALNDIWRIRTKRGPVTRFTVYWAVLTLGPLLVGVSLAVSSYLVSLPLLSNVDASLGLKAGFLGILPFMATAVALCLLYMVVPNCKVPGRYAIVGGVIAALLFEGAKRAFALYVTKVPTYAIIYGALAAIPIFLIWVYVSWAVTLFGAQITYCLTNFRALQAGREAVVPELDLIYTFRIVGHLWKAQRRGEALAVEKLAECEPDIGDTQLMEILGSLDSGKIVHRTDTGEWALSRDIGEMTARDIFDVRPTILPDLQGDWVEKDRWSRALHNLFGKMVDQNRSVLNVALKEVYEYKSDDAESVVRYKVG